MEIDRSDPAFAAMAPKVATRRTYLRPRRGWSMVDLPSLWNSRDLLWMFVLRDIKVQYKQTFFGFAWAIIVPFVQIIVFSIFFGRLLGVGDRVNEISDRVIPYPLFVLSGQVIWNFFHASVLGASNSLLHNAAIIRKVYVPRLVLPVAGIGKPIMDALVAMGFLFAVTFWYAGNAGGEVWLTPKLPLTIILLLASIIPALGLGMFFAAVTVHYRDLTLIIPFIMQTLFYVTPVIYPGGILPEGFQWLLYLNPVSGFVSAHRACVLDFPIDWLGLAISGSISLSMLGFGAFYFTRAERYFADVA